MSLIIEQSVCFFDTSQVKCGDLLWGKHKTWIEGKAGFVTSVKEKQIIVQYYPGIGNVTNHFIIPAAEVSAGDWSIRWTSNLKEVQSYNEEIDDEQQEKEETDESGGTDLPEIC